MPAATQQRAFEERGAGYERAWSLLAKLLGSHKRHHRRIQRCRVDRRVDRRADEPSSSSPSSPPSGMATGVGEKLIKSPPPSRPEVAAGVARRRAGMFSLARGVRKGAGEKTDGGAATRSPSSVVGTGAGSRGLRAFGVVFFPAVDGDTLLLEERATIAFRPWPRRRPRGDAAEAATPSSWLLPSSCSPSETLAASAAATASRLLS